MPPDNVAMRPKGDVEPIDGASKTGLGTTDDSRVMGGHVFSRVLFPTDCSQGAEPLVAVLSGMVPRPDEVVIATVVPVSGLEQPIIEEHVASARRRLAELAGLYDSGGTDVRTEVLSGRAAPAIINAARDLECDGMLVGSYGKEPLQEVLRGSVSAELIRSSELPVLSVRIGALSGKDAKTCTAIGARLLSSCVVALDGCVGAPPGLSRLAEAMNRAAPHLKQPPQAHLVHLRDDAYRDSGSRRPAEQVFSAAVEVMNDAGIDVRTQLIEGDPVADVMRLAWETGAGCIVAGSHGKGLVREAIVGGFSQTLLRMSSHPVLVMR